MKSIQHVLWRGALALSLVAAGIGSSLGMPAAETVAKGDACTATPRVMIVRSTPSTPLPERAIAIMVRRGLTPAG